MKRITDYFRREWRSFAALVPALAAVGLAFRLSGVTDSPVTYSQVAYTASRSTYCVGEVVEWQHTLEWRDYAGPLNQRQMLRQYRGPALIQSTREIYLIIDEYTPRDLTVSRSFWIDPALNLMPGEYEIVVFTYSPLEARAGDGYSVPFTLVEECVPDEITPEATITPTLIPSGMPLPSPIVSNDTPAPPASATATRTPGGTPDATATPTPLEVTPIGGPPTYPYPSQSDQVWIPRFNLIVRTSPEKTATNATAERAFAGREYVVYMLYEYAANHAWGCLTEMSDTDWRQCKRWIVLEADLSPVDGISEIYADPKPGPTGGR